MTHLIIGVRSAASLAAYPARFPFEFPRNYPNFVVADSDDDSRDTGVGSEAGSTVHKTSTPNDDRDTDKGEENEIRNYKGRQLC